MNAYWFIIFVTVDRMLTIAASVHVTPAPPDVMPINVGESISAGQLAGIELLRASGAVADHP